MQASNKSIETFLAFSDDLVYNCYPGRKYGLARVVRGNTEKQAEDGFRSALDIEVRYVELPGFYFISNTAYGYISKLGIIEQVELDVCYSGKPCSKCIVKRMGLLKAVGFGAMADEIDRYCWPNVHKCYEPSFEVWIVNIEKLKSTMMKLRGELSKAFDQTTGIFTYGETKIEVTGRLEKRLLSILANNINSIVDNDKVYKYVYGDTAFENHINSGNDSTKASAYARLEVMFRSLKKKFNKLNEVIVFKQEKGYGIFSK